MLSFLFDIKAAAVRVWRLCQSFNETLRCVKKKKLFILLRDFLNKLLEFMVEFKS